MLGVLILAGGNATRLPGKMEREFRGEPLILRAFRNVRSAGRVYVSANREFPRAIQKKLTCPILPDRFPGAGPLEAMHTCFGQMGEARVFVISGDLPFASAQTAAELLESWGDDIDGVVPEDASGEVQPLCAIYDRERFLKAASEAIASGTSSVKSAMVRLRIRRVRLRDDRVLAGVNTPEDLVAVRTFDLGIRPGA
ncbi:MAG TPA: molybdenum cofactor guanylyltransferase [Candidatus Baltobacteraceae bacterium]|nr:molybdenum cofactor guanylyltransferase [Candidatus Baltobacteraceae bacterium]